MRWLVFFLCLTSACWAKSVEIYEDWRPDATGDASFLSIDSSYYSAIGSKLKEKGYSARFWDRKAHLPWLTTWKAVHDWNDFLHWLGLNRSRQEVLESDTAYLVFSGIGPGIRDLNLARIPKEKMILFIWEPPAVQPEAYDPIRQSRFHKIYTFNDDLVDHVRFFKFYLPYLSPRVEPIVPYEERKFLTLIASRMKSCHLQELYSQREKLIRFFEARPFEPFDLYGRYWEKLHFVNYRGSIPGKLQVLKNYKFAIAYENSHINGYITEKLWDCFAMGVVPVYWGADNITDYVPADCFIDRRRFKDDAEMLAFLKAMPREEWEGYVKRSGAFLKTKTAQLFTNENYARKIAEAVDHSTMQKPSS